MVKLFILLLIVSVMYPGCSSLSLKTHHGWFGPTTYELTDGEISIYYYNGDCCCIAEQVLKELKNRVSLNQVDWEKFKNKKFAEQYLKQLCNELKGNETKKK